MNRIWNLNNSGPRIAIAIVVIILLTACQGGTIINNTDTITVRYGGTWYVDENGSDSNDGLSKNTSLATLNKALSLVRAAYSGAWPGKERSPLDALIIVAGTITKDDFESNARGMIYIDNSEWDNYPPLVIEGSTVRPGIIDAESKDKRVLYIDNATVTLSGLTLTGGEPVSYYDDNYDYDPGCGGGIFVTGFSSFTMNGGVITGNTASFGGGVDVESSSTFKIMGGATIAGNTANGNGGGVYIGTFGRLTMYERASITGNSAVGDGGGVLIDNSSRLTMYEKASITNNSARGEGGGVGNSGSFIMDSGIISGNTAYNGGGVAGFGDDSHYTGFWSSSFLMGEKASITGNTAIVSGGGLYTYFGDFTMNGGLIADNIGTSGGGVYAYNITMNGGTITGNTADDGGGVYAYYYFTMNGGTITGNTANDGGGLYYWDWDEYDLAYLGHSIFSMSGGSITGNTARSNGGGVYCIQTDYMEFTKTGNSLIDGYSSGNDEKKNNVKNSDGIQNNAGHAVYMVFEWEDIYDDNNNLIRIPISAISKEHDSPSGQNLIAIGTSFNNNWDY